MTIEQQTYRCTVLWQHCTTPSLYLSRVRSLCNADGQQWTNTSCCKGQYPVQHTHPGVVGRPKICFHLNCLWSTMNTAPDTLQLLMVWSRNDSGMTPCCHRERWGSTGCPVSVLLAIVTCVCGRWLSEGQVKRRLVALSTLLSTALQLLQSCKHTKHVITHCPVLCSAVFKVLHFRFLNVSP